MQEAFLQFLQDPTQERYLALREQVVAAETYRPYTEGLLTLAKLHEEERHEELLQAAEVVVPNFLLTPSLHYYLGRAHAALGNGDAENLERHIFAACRDALLATGDGTPTKPYLVTQLDDEREIMGFIGRTAVQQALVKHEDGRFFDVWTDEKDAEETWFDITELVLHTPEMHHLVDDPERN